MHKDVKVVLTDEDKAEATVAARASYERRMKCHKATTEDELSVEEWLAIRKEAGKAIDPETAEVTWCYVDLNDPYGVYDGPPGETNYGRHYFARGPGSDIWVSFRDLPQEIRDALRDKH